MSTPTVTEVVSRGEPVLRDPFIDDLADAAWMPPADRARRDGDPAGDRPALSLFRVR